MSSVINADTSDGLKFTSDTSGEIKLQSAGTDIATVNSSGITMASGKAISGAGAGGKVLQVVQALSDTTQSTSSGSLVATDLSGSITPSSASSKVLVMVNLAGAGHSGGSAVHYALYRNGSINQWIAIDGSYNGSASSTLLEMHYGITYLDSPATTSSVTYAIYYAGRDGGTTYINGSGGANDLSTITLMEIAG